MLLPVRLHPEADAEFADAARFYDQEAPVVGVDFVQLVDAAFDAIGEFPYSIFYHVGQAAILVLAVEHHKRRPGTWMHRVPSDHVTR